jgi:hypothetical protein
MEKLTVNLWNEYYWYVYNSIYFHAMLNSLILS